MPPGQDPARLTQNVGAVIGIVTGILGCLLTIGFAFLPTSTVTEKGYVTGASFAVSVAAVSGIGAWRSVRRFGLTAALTGIALICLAGLSVAVQRNDAAQVSGGSSSAPGAASSGSPSSALSTGSACQPLVHLAAVDGGSGSSYASGPQKVNTQNNQETLYSAGSGGSGTYELDRKCRSFRAVVGLADSSASGATCAFSLLVDGQAEGGNPTLEVGETQVISASVAGAFRITLQDSCQDGSATAVWINPVVSG